MTRASSRARPLLTAAASTLAIGLLAAACSKPSADGVAPAGSSAPSPGSAAALPSAATSAAATPAAAGPAVAIPAGKLLAGTACGEHPRVPAEELAGDATPMSAFDIDAYPYPNDPARAPLTGVSRDEAARLCADRGRRLCTELEWENACKGPKNTRYEYGDRFDAKACPTGLGAAPAPGGFDRCTSGFGVHAMHGFVWEWTASDWKRGSETGKAALRGGYGNAPYAHMRCSGAKAEDPATKAAAVGFRCCGGAANTSEIVIPADDPAPPALAEEKPADAALLARLDRALVNGSLRAPEGTTSSFTRVWRWHAAPREEVILARYESKSADGATVVQPLVVRLCDRSVQLIGRLRAPVEAMEDPEVSDEAPGKLILKVKDGANSGEVKLTYQYAQVATEQPAWVKAGAAASAAPGASAAPAVK